MIALSSAVINPGPVFQAGKAPTITAAQTTLPSMRGTVLGWFKPMIIGIVSTVIAESGDNDGQAVATIRELRTSGVIQAGNDEKLSPQAEGQRSWDNATLWVLPQLDVPTSTKIKIDGKLFLVMGKQDWSTNGFMRYDLTETFA